MRLLVDMNLSPRWVDFLRAAGHEATHWSEIGDARATDAHIMAVAADQRAIVLTNDLDFGTILAARGHSGLALSSSARRICARRCSATCCSPRLPRLPRNFSLGLW